MPTMKVRLIAAAASAALAAIALTAPAPALASAARPASTSPCNNFEGGNGKDYRDLAGGVYGWTLKDKHPLGDSKGFIYAGMSGNLKQRRAYWVRWAKPYEKRGDKFTWHVLTRDWSTKYFGKLPAGLTLKQVRLGAEQIAIDAFRSWGKKNGYTPYNQINAISTKNKDREKMMNAGDNLLCNQMENNAPPGDEESDGDEYNLGDEIDAGAMAEIPGGGGDHGRCDAAGIKPQCSYP